jgi:hypothetical protein
LLKHLLLVCWTSPAPPSPDHQGPGQPEIRGLAAAVTSATAPAKVVVDPHVILARRPHQLLLPSRPSAPPATAAPNDDRRPCHAQSRAPATRPTDLARAAMDMEAQPSFAAIVAGESSSRRPTAEPAIAVRGRGGGARRRLHHGHADYRRTAPAAARLEGRERGSATARVGSPLGHPRRGRRERGVRWPLLCRTSRRSPLQTM